MNLLTNKYFTTYKQHLPTDISSALQGLDALEVGPHSFTFYTSVAVISSSRIEGEQMEADSYVKHKTQGVEYLPELVEKPNDLYRCLYFCTAA